MNWTKDNPTQLGFYWLKFGPGFEGVVEVVEHSYEDGFMFYFAGVEMSYDFVGVKDPAWYGPLTVPDLPKERP